MGFVRLLSRVPPRTGVWRVPPVRFVFSGFRKDPYSILGVSRNESLDTIKAQYRKLVRENHPDRFPDPKARAEATKRVAQINAAWGQVRQSHGAAGQAAGGGAADFNGAFNARRSNTNEDNVQMQITLEQIRLWSQAHNNASTQSLLLAFRLGVALLRKAYECVHIAVVTFPIAFMIPAFSALPAMLVKFSLCLVACAMVDGVMVMTLLWVLVRMGYARMPGYYRKQAVRNVEERIARAAAEAAS